MTSSAASIDRTSPMPLYSQLGTALQARIESGEWGPGDRIPGDHELCAEYDVSRTVVRQALGRLEFDGLIHKIRGRGTYVSRPKASQGLVQSLSGLFEEITSRGATIRSDVLALDVRPAPAAIAVDLRLATGDPVVRLERLRYVDEVPWVHTTTHLPARLVPGLEREDFTAASLYERLDTVHGIQLARGHRSLEAVLSTIDTAALLQIPTGSPLLLLRSVSSDAAGRPVETFVSYNRSDVSRFEVDVVRAPRA